MLELKNPPRMYQGDHDTVEEHGIWAWSKDVKLVWNRVLQLFHRYAGIDIASHRVYRFKVQNTVKNLAHMLHSWNEMQVGNVRRWNGSLPNILDSRSEQQVDVMPDVERPIKVLTQLPYELADLESLDAQLPFDILFKLNVLMSHDILSKFSLTKHFVKMLHLNSQNENDMRSTAAVLEVFYMQKRKLYTPAQNFMDIRDQALEWVGNQNKLISAHCTVVRKVVVTPTRLVLMPTSIDVSNRVLR